MSAELAARAAILTALRSDATLLGLVNQIADGDPVKASAPWLLVGGATATGWGARGVEGVTLRQSFELAMRGTAVTDVSAVLGQIDFVLKAMPGELGDWRITSLNLERSRIRRTETEWRAGADYSIRLVRLV